MSRRRRWAPVGAGGRRVLVVEDEDPLARLVAGYLARDGFEATVVGDGARAGKVARTLDPDVVVLDLRLPGLDRLGCARRCAVWPPAPTTTLTKPSVRASW